MIDNKVLEGVKLVSDESYFATSREVDGFLEQAFTQASQGWGINLTTGVTIRLAKELLEAQEIATKAQDDHNKLKGLQLENGRLRKRITTLDAMLIASKHKAKDDLTHEE